MALDALGVCRAGQACVLQLLGIGQIAQAFHSENRQKTIRGDKGIGGPSTRFAGTGANQIMFRKPSDQITADLAPEDIFQAIAADGLMG